MTATNDESIGRNEKRDWFCELLPRLWSKTPQVSDEEHPEEMVLAAATTKCLLRLETGLWACWGETLEEGETRLVVCIMLRAVSGSRWPCLDMLNELMRQSEKNGYELKHMDGPQWQKLGKKDKAQKRRDQENLQQFISALPANTRRQFLRDSQKKTRHIPAIVRLQMVATKTATMIEPVGEATGSQDAQKIGDRYTPNSHPFQDFCGDICEPEENAFDEATDTCMSIEYESDGTYLEDFDHDRTPQQDDGDDWTPYEEDDDGWVP